MFTVRWIVFILYLAIVYFIGYWSYKRSKTLSDFYVAGKGLGRIPLVGTFTASFVSAASILGYVAFSYQNGWSLITIYGIGCAGGWMLLGFISDRLRNFDAGVTSPDIYAERYSSNVMRVWTAIVFIVWQTLFLIQQFMGVGYTVQGFLGIPYQAAVIIIGTTMIFYVVAGGMKSVVWTDTIQTVIMLLGVFIATFAVWKIGGGLSGINTLASKIVQEGRSSGFMLDALSGGRYSVFYVVMTAFSLAAVITCVPFYHRMFFSARTPKLARGTVGLATPLLIIFYLCLAFLGVAARVMLPEIETVDRAFLVLVDSVLAPILGTLILTCFVAAIMSTVDSLLMATGAMVSHDIYSKIINKKISPEQEMKITRISLVVIGVGGMLLSLKPPGTIMDMYNVIIAVVSSTLFPALMLGLFWRRATLEGAMVGSVAGFFSSWAWLAFGSATIPPSAVGIPVSTVLIIIISLMTPKPPEQAITQFFPSRR